MILEFKVDELSVQGAWLKTLYDLIDELNCKGHRNKNTNVKREQIKPLSHIILRK